MRYQVDYKNYSSDKILHSRLFPAKNKEEAKNKFKEYCNGMGIRCEVINIIKL